MGKSRDVFIFETSENATSVFKDPDVTKTVSTLYDKYVVIPADKAQNCIVL